jgi:tetratricopeptide (TPR) repeat protein
MTNDPASVEPRTAPGPATTPGPPWHVYLFVALLLAAILTGTTLLARHYQMEKTARSNAHFARGQVLVATGELEAGVAELRAAVALNRGSGVYARVLARALADAGAPREAQTYLDGVLARDPTSGIANLTRAQVLRTLGDTDGAETYYRRAWFGVWPEGQQQRALVGFELAEYLLDRGEIARAIGVLSQLAVDMPATVSLFVRLGALFLQAGAPADAVPPLERAVQADPDNAEAWHTLAEAQFGGGQYATARLAALRAIDLVPDDQEARRLAEVSAAVIALDPGQPRLATRERLRRWQQLLALAADAFDACVPEPGDALAAAVDRARTLRALPVGSLDEELVQPVVEQLWRARTAECPDVPPEYEPLSLVLTSLGTRESAR